MLVTSIFSFSHNVSVLSFEPQLSFYVYTLINLVHFLPSLSACLSIFLSVCLQNTLTLAINFEWYVIKLTYFTCVFVVVRHFLWCQGQNLLKTKFKYQGYIFQNIALVFHKDS